jgi:hypothetical protein
MNQYNTLVTYRYIGTEGNEGNKGPFSLTNATNFARRPTLQMRDGAALR